MGHARRLGAAGALLVVFLWPSLAMAWNPLKAAANGLRKAGDAVLSFMGAPLGGLVDKAAAPAIHDLGQTGYALLADADVRLDRQVEHASSLAGKLVGEVNVDLGQQIDHVDRSLEARLVQVQRSGDELLDRTFAHLDETLGRVDDILGKRIDQVLEGAQVVLTKVDGEVQRTLAQADAILQQRIGDVQELVRSTIEQADRVAAARIEQVDEIAGRRIANLDVIATKQTLAIEGGLLRLAAFIGLLAFVAFAAWRLFTELGRSSELVRGRDKRYRRVLWHASPRLGLQLLVATLGGGALLYLGHVLPMHSEHLAAQQKQEHRDGFAAAMRAYDFTSMRYHAAQLEILDPDQATTYRALVRKAELLRTVLERPALLQSLQGIASLQGEVGAVEAAVDAADLSLHGPGKDRDLLVLKAYILWQVGASRADEHEAAALCAEALETRESALPGGFLLEPLAWNYLAMFLANPYESEAEKDRVGLYDLARLRAVFARGAGRADAEAPRFAALLTYDRLVVQLMQKATPAYLAMLRAHAAFVAAADPSAAKAALAERQEQARAVVEAWQAFDAALESSPWLAEDVVALAAFTLDDVVPMRARYFLLVPDATTLAPAYVLAAPPAAEVAASKRKPAAPPTKTSAEVVLRLKMAPLRVAWARRYASLLGPGARDVLAFEEAERFRRLEERDRRFEEAFVGLLAAAKGKPPAKLDLAASAAAAAEGAALMGLYEGSDAQRAPLATAVVATWKQLAGAGAELPDEVKQKVREGYEERTLRLF